MFGLSPSIYALQALDAPLSFEPTVSQKESRRSLNPGKRMQKSSTKSYYTRESNRIYGKKPALLCRYI